MAQVIAAAAKELGEWRLRHDTYLPLAEFRGAFGAVLGAIEGVPGEAE